MSDYVPTSWVDGTTPVNAARMNHAEAEIDALNASVLARGGGVDYIGNYAAGTAYKRGDVVLYNGVQYLCVNPGTGQTPPGVGVTPAGAPTVPLVTTLPASPFDGQEVILVDSISAPTHFWRFRYTASITDAYKWLFMGGPPKSAQGTGNLNVASTTYVGGGVCPSFTVPRAGYYYMGLDAQILPAHVDGEWGMLAIKIGAAVVSDEEAILATGGAALAANNMFQHPYAQFVRFAAAGDTLTVMGRSATGVNTMYDRMHLWALPARVA